MTNKVKFKLKITGFELEMEGTKEGTAAITNQVGEALRGLMTPPLMEEEPNKKPVITEDAESTVVSSSTNGSSKKKIARRAAPRANTQGAGEVKAAAIDFKHEPEKFGSPLQEWVTSTKGIWLLYVLKSALNMDGLTTLQITETFNKHFRQSKLINRGNVFRDLGKLKAKANSLVGEDTSQNPPIWYLTEAGQRAVQKLIEEQKAKTNGVS